VETTKTGTSVLCKNNHLCGFQCRMEYRFCALSFPSERKKIKVQFAICNIEAMLMKCLCISIILVLILSLKHFLDSYPDVMSNWKSNSHISLIGRFREHSNLFVCASARSHVEWATCGEWWHALLKMEMKGQNATKLTDQLIE
jgi:hypothetical protein